MARPDPRSRLILGGGAAAVVVAAVTAALIVGGSADARVLAGPTIPAPTPTEVEGNATTCSGGQNPANLPGEELLSGDTGPDSGPAGDATVSADGTTLTVHINPGWTASGIVVKGGPNYNLYTGPFVGEITITGLISPPVGTQSNTPEISHYLVCGSMSATTTPATGTPTAPPTTETVTPTETVTTTRTAPTETTATTPVLPKTGGAAAGVLIAGAALLAGGLATLILVRRRRDAESL